jgi:hypothetical protein
MYFFLHFAHNLGIIGLGHLVAFCLAYVSICLFCWQFRWILQISAVHIFVLELVHLSEQSYFHSLSV